MTQPPDPSEPAQPQPTAQPWPPGALHPSPTAAQYPPPAFGSPPPGSAYPPPPGYAYPPPPGYVYPPPQGGWPPGYRPPPQPRRGNNKILIGVGAGVLVVVLICVGLGFLAKRAATNLSRAASASRPTAPAAPNFPTVPGPLATLQAQQMHAVNSDGTPLALGATLTVQNGLGDKVRFTVSRVRFQKKPCSPVAELPRGMGLLITDLTVRVDAGSLKPTEFDFALTLPGQQPITGFEGLLSGCGKGLSTTIQRAGTTQHANLIFVTDARHGEIVYRPLLSPTPVGSWNA